MDMIPLEVLYMASVGKVHTYVGVRLHGYAYDPLGNPSWLTLLYIDRHSCNYNYGISGEGTS